VIPNDRLLSISDRHVSVLDAFKAADQVLLSGVQGITDLITTPGLINLDFADVKSVMSGAGSALMGIGSSRGDDRAVAAAEMAISSPLLEASIDGAHGVLLSIQGGSDLGLFEINEAAQLVANSAAPDANIIFGAVIDDALGDEVRVTVIAAGFDEAQSNRARPGRPAVTYPAPSHGSDAFSASWQPVSLPALTEPAAPAEPVPATAADDARRAQVAAAAAAAIVPPPRPDLDAAAGLDGSLAQAVGAASQSATTTAAEAVGRLAQPSRDPMAAVRAGDSASTRRRSVVFEEDDELDVPDFLK
jgi:cell division protein FtsZ